MRGKSGKKRGGVKSPRSEAEPTRERVSFGRADCKNQKNGGKWGLSSHCGQFAWTRVTDLHAAQPDERWIAGAKKDHMDINISEQIVFGVMEKRRSVQEYLPEPVDPIALKRIASAGALAPSSGNGQPCRFLVIDDRDKIGMLLDRSIDVNDEKSADENEK